ncbi:hypothetical protein SCLCIDRAFT_1222985 [Scleroderma citrinum Foug A]|uniref:Uncharacterized protein n=1 Tax=Scleroderma citrinum Foug A TaxID=1036808 RepID=A0A0C3DAX4_9AGAM|nr:hypothetical protein SCLCIDRAFT_1222985 [Scleroderma citrinum Foug A]
MEDHTTIGSYATTGAATLDGQSATNDGLASADSSAAVANDDDDYHHLGSPVLPSADLSRLLVWHSFRSARYPRNSR